MPSLADVLTTPTEEEAYQESLASIQAAGTRTTDWTPDAPTQVGLRHGFAPLIRKAREAIAQVAAGGFLSLAQVAAEADPAGWESGGDATWLAWLAREYYQVTVEPPVFAERTVRFTNAGTTLYTLDESRIVKTPQGQGFRVVPEAPPATLAGGASVIARVRALQPGPAGNAGAITANGTSMPGVTVADVVQGANASNIVVYGAPRETPRAVVQRCQANWGRLAVLQTSPASAYKALALDSRITGTRAVRKVAVWGHFSALVMGQAANCVTLFLGGDAGPVTQAIALQVEAALAPYGGLHDKIFARPCIAASYAPAAVVKVRLAAQITATQLAVAAVFAQLRSDLDIGQPVLAWDLRRRLADVATIANLVDSFVDYTPPKNGLVDAQPTNFTYEVL